MIFVFSFFVQSNLLSIAVCYAFRLPPFNYLRICVECFWQLCVRANCYRKSSPMHKNQARPTQFWVLFHLILFSGFAFYPSIRRRLIFFLDVVRKSYRAISMYYSQIRYIKLMSSIHMHTPVNSSCIRKYDTERKRQQQTQNHIWSTISGCDFSSEIMRIALMVAQCTDHNGQCCRTIDTDYCRCVNIARYFHRFISNADIFNCQKLYHIICST